MKPMIDAKKELLKELIKSMQAKMLEDEEVAEPVEGCEVCEEQEEVEGEGEEGIDVMEVLNEKKPQLPKPKITIAMLGAKLSQMKSPSKKK